MCFKFHQNRTIIDEFNFFEEGEGGGAMGKGTPIDKFQLLLVNLMKMLSLRFNLNRTINEEFDFWGVKALRGRQGHPISKIRKKNPHTERWFQPTPKISAF